jgi:hypothetical protein
VLSHETWPLGSHAGAAASIQVARSHSARFDKARFRASPRSGPGRRFPASSNRGSAIGGKRQRLRVRSPFEPSATPFGNDRCLRKADPVCCRRQRSSRTLSCRERRRCCRGPRSQPPGGENRLPEKRTQKHDNKDAKDKAPPTGTEGVIVLGGQPVGIAHVETIGRPPSKLSLTPDC